MPRYSTQSAFTLASLIVCLWAAGCTHRPHTEGRDDWFSFRGNAMLNGYSAHSLPDKPVLLWKVTTNTRTVASPIVQNGCVYWSDKKGMIHCVNEQGEVTHRFETGTSMESTPLLHDSILYCGTNDGRLLAYSTLTNDTLWSFATEGQISGSPNVFRRSDGGTTIVFGSYDSYAYGVDAVSGQQISKISTGYYINGAIAMAGKHAIVGGCDSWIRVVDMELSHPTDSLLAEAYIPMSAAVIDHHAYIADYSGNLYALTLEQGRIKEWHKMVTSTDEADNFTSVPACTNQHLLLLNTDGYLHCYNRETETLRWKFLLGGNIGESSPVICHDKVIVCNKSGRITIVNLSDGALRWEYDTGEQIVGSPAIVRNGFFVLTAKGSLLKFGN